MEENTFVVLHCDLDSFFVQVQCPSSPAAVCPFVQQQRVLDHLHVIQQLR